MNTIIYGRLRKFPKKQKNRIMSRDGRKCKICGCYEDLTIDHIVPVSKGGSNRDNNLMTLCLTCNQRKGSDIYHQFIRI
jgi:5-methylcytosine-specific restriction endonuclease McrA